MNRITAKWLQGKEQQMRDEIVKTYDVAVDEVEIYSEKQGGRPMLFTVRMSNDNKNVQVRFNNGREAMEITEMGEGIEGYKRHLEIILGGNSYYDVLVDIMGRYLR